jgi:DNA-binding CsgD family transcriptional regulator
MSNFFSNSRAKVDFYFFTRILSRNYTHPVCLVGKELDDFFAEIRGRSSRNKQFFIAAGLKSLEVLFTHRLSDFVKVSENFSLKEYLNLIHPDYLVDYLAWGRAAYVYVSKNPEAAKPLEYCFRINFPMQLKDGNYYWVLMECYSLQIDKSNNILAQFNAYTIVDKYESRKKIPLAVNIWNDNFGNEAFTKELWKCHFILKPFVLTGVQREIFDLIKGEPTLSNSEVAERLDKKINNVNVLNKQILARGRDSFPTATFTSIRDLIQFLDSIGYFELPENE